MRRVFALVALLVWSTGLLALPAIVQAHAIFLRSEPAPNSVLDTAPERIQVWLTEPLEAGFSEVRLLNSQGQQVDSGDSRVLSGDPTSMVMTVPRLENAAYVVSWQALSRVDGHTTHGTFSLFIGVRPTFTPPLPPREFSPTVPAEAAARWLGYAGIAFSAGPLLFLLLVLGPAASQLGWEHQVFPPAVREMRLLHRGALVMLALAVVSTLAVAIASLEGFSHGGVLDTVTGLLTGSRFGTVLLARAGAVLVLGALLWRLHRAWDERTAWLAVGTCGALALTISLNSHSASLSALAEVATLADWLHLSGMMAWFGGLAALVLVLPAALAPLTGSDRWQLLAAIVPRFSLLAVVSVGVLGVTGLYAAWVHIGSIPALVETMYGKSLLAKTALVSPALLLGAANLLVVRPGLVRAVADPARIIRAIELAGRFGRTVTGELILLLFVLVAASLMTSFPPAASTYQEILATRPLSLRTVASDLTIDLSISPAQPGAAAYTVTLASPDGGQVTDAELVQLSATYLDQPLGTGTERATAWPDGTYRIEGALITVEGNWQLELLVRRPGRDDARAAWRVRYTQTSASEIDLRTGTQASQSTTNLAGLGLAVFGIALLVYVVRSVGLRSANGFTLGVVCIVVIGIGSYLVTRSAPAPPPEDIRSMVNPFPPTEASITVGEGIYRNQCQMCHGATGRGDGPAGLGLNPRPADFRVHMAAGHTDGELFNWISNGVPGTAMPPYADKLTPDERWHVINFIHTYAPALSRVLNTPADP